MTSERMTCACAWLLGKDGRLDRICGRRHQDLPTLESPRVKAPSPLLPRALATFLTRRTSLSRPFVPTAENTVGSVRYPRSGMGHHDCSSREATRSLRHTKEQTRGHSLAWLFLLLFFPARGGRGLTIAQQSTRLDTLTIQNKHNRHSPPPPLLYCCTSMSRRSHSTTQRVRP